LDVGVLRGGTQGGLTTRPQVGGASRRGS
jgi:hypothetical protein